MSFIDDGFFDDGFIEPPVVAPPDAATLPDVIRFVGEFDGAIDLQGNVASRAALAGRIDQQLDFEGEY